MFVARRAKVRKAMRILIIDDEPRWIEFVKGDLDTFEIAVAVDVTDAMQQLEKDEFDLIIASSRRLDALEKIHQQYAKRQRVVVTTIRPTEDEALAAFRLGAMRYFAKSFKDEDLRTEVASVLPIETDAAQ